MVAYFIGFLFSYVMRLVHGNSLSIQLVKGEIMSTMPPTQLKKVDVEITKEINDIILRAAQLKMMPLSTFFINAAYEDAKLVLKEHETLMLTLEEHDRLMMLLENPPKPNDKLKAAMRQYRHAS
jgi:uncharacterized protein (DUF1778 family)